MVCPSATSEAEARWPRFGSVVVATTSRRDNKDQMIRPLVLESSSGLRGHKRTYLTILESADHALFKMVRYVLL
jgi:hypothetical protein